MLVFQKYFQLGNFLISVSYFNISVVLFFFSGMFWQGIPRHVEQTPDTQLPGLPVAGNAVGGQGGVLSRTG